MSKLIHFKEWLTIKEASQYLSTVLDEKVKAKDLYLLALENKLTLSLYFINTTPIELATTNNSATHNCFVFKGHYQQVQAGACYDLINQYTSQLILKQHCFNKPTIPLTIEPTHNQGILCLLPDELNYGRLIHATEDNNPLLNKVVPYCLPNDIYLVVKTRHLFNFIKQANNKKTVSKAIHDKERISLYKLIMILANMAELPINHSYKTADLIIEIAPNYNIASPSRETLAKYLKDVYSLLAESNQ